MMEDEMKMIKGPPNLHHQHGCYISIGETIIVKQCYKRIMNDETSVGRGQRK
jgi:hypothetical protein